MILLSHDRVTKSHRVKNKTHQYYVTCFMIVALKHIARLVSNTFIVHL